MQTHAATARRPAGVDRHRDGRESVKLALHTGRDAGERQDRKGQVGALAIPVRAQEDTERRGAHRHRAAPKQRIFECDTDPSERRVVALVEGLGAVEPVREHHLKMILQIRTDAGAIEHDVDAMFREMLRRS